MTSLSAVSGTRETLLPLNKRVDAAYRARHGVGLLAGYAKRVNRVALASYSELNPSLSQLTRCITRGLVGDPSRTSQRRPAQLPAFSVS